MEKNDKQYTEGISAGASKSARWFDNFWYHYKWTTIIVVFFLIVGIICTAQMCTKKNSDITLVYAGSVYLDPEASQNICRALESVCPPEIAKKGKAAVGLSSYYILSKEQLEALEKETHEDGEDVFVNRQYYTNQYDTYYDYISTGDSSVLLVERWLYEQLLENERLAPLSESLGEKPLNAFSEYGIELGDTAIYNDYSVVRKLPEDTVVCILRPYVFGKSSKEKYYKLEQKMLEAIVDKRID